MADTVQFNPSTGKVNVTDESFAPAVTAFALGAGMAGIGGGMAGFPSTGSFVPIGAAAVAGIALPFNASELVKVQMTPTGVPCNHCTIDGTSTPSQADIIISDVVACDGCFADAASIKYENIADISGTYRVTQDSGDACQWDYAEEGSYGTVTQYSDTLCESVVRAWVLDRLYIRITRSGDKLVCDVHAVDSSYPEWPYGYSWYWIYEYLAAEPDEGKCIGMAQRTIEHPCLGAWNDLVSSIKYFIDEK